MKRIARRHLLKTLGAGAGAAVGMNLVDVPFWSARTVEADSGATVDFAVLAPISNELETMADVALNETSELGCSYSDIQIDSYRDVWVGWPGGSGPLLGAHNTKENPVSAVIESKQFGFGVRVIHAGDWGLAASRSDERVEPYEILNISAQPVTSAQRNATLSPDLKDRFGMPTDDWLAFWRTLDGAENRAKGVRIVNSGIRFRVVDTFYAATEGRRTPTISTVTSR